MKKLFFASAAFLAFAAFAEPDEPNPNTPMEDSPFDEPAPTTELDSAYQKPPAPLRKTPKAKPFANSSNKCRCQCLMMGSHPKSAKTFPGKKIGDACACACLQPDTDAD